MDLATFDAIWPRGAQILVVWYDGPADRGIQQMRARVPSDEALFFVPADGVSEQIHRVLQRFNSVFYSLFALTGLLGGVAVASMVFGSVVERRRELGLLRAQGADTRQLTEIVLWDALLVVTSALVLGTVIGLLLALPLADALTEAFGWTLTTVVPMQRVGALVGAMLLGTLVVSIYPARLAARTSTRALLQES